MDLGGMTQTNLSIRDHPLNSFEHYDSQVDELTEKSVCDEDIHPLTAIMPLQCVRFREEGPGAVSPSSDSPPCTPDLVHGILSHVPTGKNG